MQTAVASSKLSGLAAANTPTALDNIHPVPVTRDIIGCPFRIRYALFASATTSIGPLMAITVFNRSLNFFAYSAIPSIVSSDARSSDAASTPFALELLSPTNFTSEIFPRITEK